MSIAVTGGNGELGRLVLARLKTRTTEPLVATVRDLEKVDPLPGVNYRSGNFDDPATLQTSLTGARTVLINATFFGAESALRVPRVTAAIDAATKAGVERIVLTSWPRLEKATMPSVLNYAELEGAVRAAGPSWTILRFSTGMADALARDVVWGRTMGELVAPALGATAAPAAIADLAEAASIVLTSEEYDGQSLELTGPDNLTWEDLAHAAGVPFRPVSDEAYNSYVIDNFGFPPDTAALLVSLYKDFKEGRSAATDTLAGILNHAPTPGIESVQARAANFPTA